MYSTPIASQYISCKCLIMSSSLVGPIPIIDPALKVVFKSYLDKPKFSISSFGEYFLLSRTGFVLVNKWPLVR